MPIKLIALDMDGTLLNGANLITPGVRRALKSVIEAGIIVVPATGRCHSMAVRPRELFGKNFPVISSNGAYARDEDKIYHRMVMTREHARQALRIARESDCSLFLFGSEKIYCTPADMSQKIVDRWQAVSAGAVTMIADDESLINAEAEYVKILLVEYEESKFLAARARMEAEIAGVHSSMSEYGHLDITKAGAHKGFALEVLAKEFGIDMSEIMAIGDGENDVEMLQCAGIGVAMENACENAKCAGDYMTSDNENDGVAHAIYKFVLGVDDNA